MSLKERLQQDWKIALKSRDKFKAGVISMAKAAVLQVEKSGNGTVNDEKIVEILSKEVKQRRDAIEEFKKGNRQDLIDDANAEIKILMNYLPQQLTREEILEIVKIAVEEIGANSMKDMGKVMTAVMPKVKGRTDGKLVNQIVKEYLND
ncbi:GatB/YqeY domain-containing protein [Haloimpatiens sp. FM7330]|uniref:GatB/YqeY domain-containing protein n=1 Tax=Haloimpatiens sp. FM7330 TaxID=3298610 RepID=UPI00363CA419